ncbi:dehydrogenase, partial [Nocardia seriolae]
MRVVQAKEFGGPEVLGVTEVPDPVAGSGEVVVRVAAADVVFLDTTLR